MAKKVQPKPGQESVWDYPRPPKLERTTKHLRIEFSGVIIADTNRAYRVLETSHPPVYYFPPEDVRMDLLHLSSDRQTYCEFKGMAQYWNLIVEEKKSLAVAWSYPKPHAAFLPITGFLAFYSSRVDACFVNDEQVQAQAGDFYGGWITADIVGPFKGGMGTWGW